MHKYHYCDHDLCLHQACGGNGVHKGCNKQGWSKNSQKSSKSDDIEYTCTDCGGEGPTLMERERPRVISEAINSTLNSTINSSFNSSLNSSQLLASGSEGDSSINTSIVSSVDMSERKEEKVVKSGFFARKEEMLSLLAGIVERAKREDGVVEIDDEEEVGELKIDEDRLMKDEKEIEARQSENKEKKGHLWIRRDLSTFGAEALSGNICDSEDVQMEVDEPVHEDVEDGKEVEEEEVEVDEADLPGENPIRSIPLVKRTFGNRLLKMLEENPSMLRSKQKPPTCYMSFFFKMINPEKPKPPQSDPTIHCSDQAVAQSDQPIPKSDQVNPLLEKPNALSVETESEAANSKSSLEIAEVVPQENEAKKKEETEDKLVESEVKHTEVEDMEVVESNVEVEHVTEKVANVESGSLETNASKDSLVEDNESEKDQQALEIVEPKKYRRGPKSRKRLLEIKTDEESPKKVKVTDPLLEAFETDLTLGEFVKAKEVRNGETNLAFKLFKLWFKQLDTDEKKCAECGKVRFLTNCVVF